MVNKDRTDLDWLREESDSDHVYPDLQNLEYEGVNEFGFPIMKSRKTGAYVQFVVVDLSEVIK